MVIDLQNEVSGVSDSLEFCAKGGGKQLYTLSSHEEISVSSFLFYACLNVSLFSEG